MSNERSKPDHAHGICDVVDCEERYVYLGDGKRDEVLADKFGWTYHDFYGVAQQEGWGVEREG